MFKNSKKQQRSTYLKMEKGQYGTLKNVTVLSENHMKT